MLEKTIHRVSVQVADRAEVLTPPGHFKVVHVAPSRDNAEMIDIWIEVSTEPVMMKDRATRIFRIFGTGHPIPCGPGEVHLEHVGTAVTGNGLVWHTYLEGRA